MARQPRRCCSDRTGRSFYPDEVVLGVCGAQAQNYVGHYRGWNGDPPVPICDRHAAAVRRSVREGYTDDAHRITRLRPGAPWPTVMGRGPVRVPPNPLAVERNSPEWGIPAEA
jgi:hypothetical protein